MTAQLTYSDTMTIGQSGQVDPDSNLQVRAMRNDEATAEVRFGVAVKYDDAANDKTSAALMSATTEVVAGLVVRSHAYDKDTQLGDDGVLPDNMLNVARSGRMMVLCEDGCQPGDRLYIRAVATGAELKGALRASSDGTDCIDSQGQGVWDSIAAAGGLAWLIFDFTNPLT